MNAIANMTNWHRYIIGTIAIVAGILTAIIADPAVLPPDLHIILVYAPFVVLVLGGVLAGLPRFQLGTGPGAAPVLSPTPAAVTPAIGLVDGHLIVPAPPRTADPKP